MSFQNDFILTTKLNQILSWIENNANQSCLWAHSFVNSCCSLELLSFESSNYSKEIFLSKSFRCEPEESDVLIVSGTITEKLSFDIIKIHKKMAKPCWVLALGACASTGGMYDSYNVVSELNSILPVDVFVPGCPPHPMAINQGLRYLKNKKKLLTTKT